MGNTGIGNLLPLKLFSAQDKNCFTWAPGLGNADDPVVAGLVQKGHL